jgi:hypothetical protein
MLDKEITKGSYWGGSQISYWMYLVAVFFGFLGIDHLLLRSPITALLKIISIIPLFGFWYFFDIAQAFGEKDLVKKYGIAVPYYGPTGIGQGIFHDDGVKPSPEEIPRPWKFIGYFLATCLLIATPINKLVLGDYVGAGAQSVYYMLILTIILPFIAIIWGFLDVYNVIFKTRELFEKGAQRLPPATMIPFFNVDPNFKAEALGPKKAVEADTIAGAIRDAAGKLMEPVTTATRIITAPLTAVSETVSGTINTAGQVAQESIKSAGTAAQVLPLAATSLAQSAVEIGKSMQVAAQGVATLPSALNPAAIGDSVGQSVGKLTKQAGGALTGGSDYISNSSVFVFSMLGLLTASGYVFYVWKKRANKSIERSDDPPRDAAAIRDTDKDDRP